MDEIGIPWKPRHVSRQQTFNYFEDSSLSGSSSSSSTTQTNLWDSTTYHKEEKNQQTCFASLSDKEELQRATFDAEQRQTQICGLTFPARRPTRICLAFRCNDEYNPMDSTTTCRSCNMVRISERSHVDSKFQANSLENAVGWAPPRNVRLTMMMNKKSIRNQLSLKRRMDECTSYILSEKNVDVDLDQGLDVNLHSSPKNPRLSSSQSKAKAKPKPKAKPKAKEKPKPKPKPKETLKPKPKPKPPTPQQKQALRLNQISVIVEERKNTSRQFITRAKNQQVILDRSQYWVVHVPDEAFNCAVRILTSEMCQEQTSVSNPRPEFWKAVMQYSLYVSCLSAGVPMSEDLYRRQFAFNPIITNNKPSQWGNIIRMLKQRGEYPMPDIFCLVTNYVDVLCALPKITQTEAERKILQNTVHIYLKNMKEHTDYFTLGPKSERKKDKPRSNIPNSTFMNRSWALPVLICFMQVYEIEQKIIAFDLNKVFQGQTIYKQSNYVEKQKKFIESKNTHFKHIEERQEEKEGGETREKEAAALDLTYSWFLLHQRKKNGLKTEKIIPEGRWKTFLKEGISTLSQ